MNVIRNILIVLPLFSPPIVTAEPVETLQSALHQQKIIRDLRQKCQLTADSTDETVRQSFLSDQQNQATLIAAARAIKNQDKPAYRERMAQVVCPPQAG